MKTLNPVKASFIVTLDHGAIVRVTVTGDDPAHCEGLAITEVQEQCAGQVFDVSSYPFHLDDDGINILYGSSIGAE